MVIKKINLKTSYSVEKGIRILENEVRRFNFFMIQVELPVDIPDGKYIFLLKDIDDNLYYERTIKINKKDKTIETIFSHEDPLVSDEEHIFLCFQINDEVLFKLQPQNYRVELINGDGELFYIDQLDDITEMRNKYLVDYYSYTKNYKTITKKDATLTLHLGNKGGKYVEKTFQHKASQEFDFKDLIKKYEYIGIQYSYCDETPEIEEKTIIIGQKGISLSGFFIDGNETISSPFGFKRMYQREINQNEVIKIDSLSKLKQHYVSKRPYLFEVSYEFISENYLKQKTYNQDGLYSTTNIKIKRMHTENLCCTKCPFKSQCLQLIPSGLSNELMKENIGIMEHTDCEIYPIIFKTRN